MTTIILEGPDGGGKTTLAAEFKEAHGHHRVWVGHEPFTTYCHMAEAIGQVSSEPILFDRFHISEAVYSQLFRGQSPSPHKVFALEEILLDSTKGDLVLVHCTADYKTLVQRHWAKDEPDTVDLQLQSQIEMFYHWVDQSHIRHITWTGSNMTMKEVVRLATI